MQLTYYHSYEQYNKYGRDRGHFGMANAIAREVALILIDSGDVDISWAYPDDEDEAGNSNE